MQNSFTTYSDFQHCNMTNLAGIFQKNRGHKINCKCTENFNANDA